MGLPLDRRRFLCLAGLGAVGAGGYGLVHSVQGVREAARRMTDT